MEILVEAELAAAQLMAAAHGHTRGAQAVDLHAHHHHEAAEFLHVRFRGGIGEHRLALAAREAAVDADDVDVEAVVERIVSTVLAPRVTPSQDTIDDQGAANQNTWAA